jgi:WD40 repeat protein
MDYSQGIDENYSEMRSVLYEFTGHSGVIFNLRWINSESLCTTSGDRVVKVWKLTDDKTQQPE